VEGLNPYPQMSFWGATVITNVRGRKALRMRRFQENSLLPDKGIDELSSFQTAKKVLWQVKQGGFNNIWNQIFLQIAKRSYCILFVKYQSVPTSVEKDKSSKSLRETMENFRRTHVTAKQQTQCFAMAEPNYFAEGRPERNLKYTVWKPFVRIPLCSRYLERKRTRLFTVGRVVGNNFSTSSENPNLQKNLFMYKIATQESNLHEAFKSLKAKCAPGLDGMTKANYTKQLENSISKLHKDLKSHKYKPSPIKVIHIPKPNGGKRPLGISSVRDKIVQATFKKELEILYEPIFRDCSFGFRPKRSCHSALKRIKKKWQAIKWVISLDISKCFDRVQHEVLINILKKRITDQETIELIQKLLNVGYVDIHNLTKREEYKTEGTPQGSIISPLLANIYLHELDVFIQDEMIPKYTVGEKRLADKASVYRRSHVLKSEIKENPIIQELPQLKKIIPVLKTNKNILNNNANHYKEGNYYKRLHYVRYADDLLLGVVGNKEDCRKIMAQINKFLKETLKLELNLEKCSINLARETLTSFLGFEMGRYLNKIDSKNVSVDNVNIKKLTQNAINSPSLLIPVKKILDRLCIRGYVRKLPKSNRYKGKGVGKLTFASDKQIVIHFSSIIRGYVNYYMCANRRSKLWSVVHALKESCYLTLAWKHKLINKKKVIEKYGPNLRIHENGKLVTELFYPKSLKSELKFLDRSYEGYVTNLNQDLKFFIDDNKRQRKSQFCALCGSDQNLELHRINPPKIEKRKTSKGDYNRKTITLCQECHRSTDGIHGSKNKYKDINLGKL
jgi:group II intron reverse transcriptase/maturase